MSEKLDFDVRVFHPNAPSNCSMTTISAYRKHKSIKKQEYTQRVHEWFILLFDSLAICGNRILVWVTWKVTFFNGIFAIKFTRKFYHWGNIIVARNFDRWWNCKVSSKCFHIFNDFVIIFFQILHAAVGPCTFQQINVKMNSATEATDSSLRASASVAMYSFPKSFSFRKSIW